MKVAVFIQSQSGFSHTFGQSTKGVFKRIVDINDIRGGLFDAVVIVPGALSDKEYRALEDLERRQPNLFK